MATEKEKNEACKLFVCPIISTPKTFKACIGNRCMLYAEIKREFTHKVRPTCAITKIADDQ